MIVLASGSPRRAKILTALGVEFSVVKTDAPEVCYPNEPERTVRENALSKGIAAGGGRVLSADTIVWCDGRIYGKPRDLAEAKSFLRELSGRVHSVYTGVAFNGDVRVQKSDVRFRTLSDGQIDEYVAKVNPIDRAGAYDIDAFGESLIESCSGSYENIMGLPIEPLQEWGLVGHSRTKGMRKGVALKKHDEIDGVVLDFGGVMTTCTMPERVRPIVDKLGIPWTVLEEGYAKYRRLLDGDFMSIGEMYARIWADAGVSVDDETQALILKEDMASFMYPNLRTLKWMRALREKGYKIGILTNMWSEFGIKFRETFADFVAEADALVISGEEHLYKPMKEIYGLLRDRIGLDSHRLLFVDDAEANCEGARRVGWKAIRFLSNEQVECDFLHGLWK